MNMCNRCFFFAIDVFLLEKIICYHALNYVKLDLHVSFSVFTMQLFLYFACIINKRINVYIETIPAWM